MLAWELSIAMDTSFCLSALEHALRRATPEIFNTDQGSQFTCVGGIFITARRRSSDFDACWELKGVNMILLQLLEPVLLDLSSGRAAQKAPFRGELFPAQLSADLAGKTYLEFFQREKQSGRHKGIVLIRIEEQ
ncbi:MAG: DUF6932 family protein [Dehalococcoidia bacterium]